MQNACERFDDSKKKKELQVLLAGVQHYEFISFRFRNRRHYSYNHNFGKYYSQILFLYFILNLKQISDKSRNDSKLSSNPK